MVLVEFVLSSLSSDSIKNWYLIRIEIQPNFIEKTIIIRSKTSLSSTSSVTAQTSTYLSRKLRSAVAFSAQQSLHFATFLANWNPRCRYSSWRAVHSLADSMSALRYLQRSHFDRTKIIKKHAFFYLKNLRNRELFHC